MKSPKIKVVKIPLNPNLKIDKPPIFPKLTHLYLDMFENKTKIKKIYVNPNYKNNDTETTSNHPTEPTVQKTQSEPPPRQKNEPVTFALGESLQSGGSSETVTAEPLTDYPREHPVEDYQNDPQSVSREEKLSKSKSVNETKINNELTRLVQNIEDGYTLDEHEYEGSSSDEEFINIDALREELDESEPSTSFSYKNQINQRLGEKRDSFFNPNRHNNEKNPSAALPESLRSSSDLKRNSAKGSPAEGTSSTGGRNQSAGKDLEKIIDEMADSSSDEEDESVQNMSAASRKRMQKEASQMSDVSDDEFDVTPPSKYETPRDSRGYASKIPPSAEDAGYKERSRFPQPEHRSRQSIEDEKRELLFKFQLLKRSYPQANLSEHFSIRSDLDEMKAHYEMEVRRLSLDSTVEQYKTYMIGGFMACEYGLGHFCKLDMQGFAQQQISQMHKYEKLLIEIGEKSYVPAGVSNFPVEVRLMFMILLNAAIFVASKMIMKKTGTNVLNMINSMNLMGGGGGPGMPSAPPPQPKRKMRGPQFDPNNF